MKIQIEETVYEGTATKIMGRLRNQTFDPTEFPDIESYIWFLQSNVIRTTGMDCPLPDGDVEMQAQAMFRHLDRIGETAGGLRWKKLCISPTAAISI